MSGGQVVTLSAATEVACSPEANLRAEMKHLLMNGAPNRAHVLVG